jgi:Flp pilus assembly protein TadG
VKWRTDTGAVPVEFAAAIGMLLLPVFVFVVTIAPVVERRNVAGRAAAEAARAFVVADDVASGQAAAQSLVDQINAGHPFTLTLTGLSGDLDRGSVVTATVEVTMPVIIFPGVIEVDVADYTARHQEEVDLFRSLP